MKLDLSGMRCSLVLCAQDLRAGYERLAGIARTYLSLDVSKGEDCVIFLSKTRGLCKIIWSDGKGTALLCRRLHHGTFQRLLGKIEGAAVKELTYQELLIYLDGDDIEIERKNLFKG